MATISPADRVIAKRWPWILGLLVVFIVLFVLLRPILAPFIIGALLAYFGDPVVDMLERRRLGRSAGVMIVFIVFTLLLALTVLVTVPFAANQLDALIRQLPALLQWFETSLLPWLHQTLNLSEANLPSIEWGKGLLSENWQSLGKWVTGLGRTVTGSGLGVLGWLASMALVPVVAFYLMRDWDLLVEKALHLVPVDWQQGVTDIVREADEVVGAFLRGQLLVMLALTFVYGTGLWLVGVQLALALGLIAGLASIVPYLGFVVGVTASLIAAYAQFGDLTSLLLVALVFGVGQALESMVLTPILVGDRIGLHPVVVIFALMAGGQLAGFLGVLVALPVSAVIAVFARHGLSYYLASDVYSGDGRQ